MASSRSYDIECKAISPTRPTDIGTCPNTALGIGRRHSSAVRGSSQST